MNNIKELWHEAQKNEELKKMMMRYTGVYKTLLFIICGIIYILYKIVTGDNQNTRTIPIIITIIILVLLISKEIDEIVELKNVLSLLFGTKPFSSKEPDKRLYLPYRIILINQIEKFILELNKDYKGMEGATKMFSDFIESVGGMHVMSEGEYQFYSGNEHARFSTGEYLYSTAPSAIRLTLPFLRPLFAFGAAQDRRKKDRSNRQAIERIKQSILVLDESYNIHDN